MQKEQHFHVWLSSHSMFPNFEEKAYPKPAYFESVPGSITMQDVFNRMKRDKLVDPRVETKDAMYYVSIGCNSWASQTTKKTRSGRRDRQESQRRDIMNQIELVRPDNSNGEKNFKMTLSDIHYRQEIRRLPLIDMDDTELKIYVYWHQILFKRHSSLHPTSFIMSEGVNFDTYYRQALKIRPSLAENLERIQMRSGPKCLDFFIMRSTIRGRLPNRTLHTETQSGEEGKTRETTIDPNYRIELINGEYELKRIYGL